MTRQVGSVLVMLSILALLTVGRMQPLAAWGPPRTPTPTLTPGRLLPSPGALREDRGNGLPRPRLGEGGRSEGHPRLRASAQNVELVGQIGGACYAVAVQGRYAYIGVGPRLVVLDVSDPARPTLLGCTALLPGVVYGIAPAGSCAYVATGDTGLRVIEVSDPASLREVGAYDTPGYALGVAVAGTLAYVADYSAGLRVIDVSNPAAPRELGAYDTPGWAWGVALAGTLAYVADYDAGLRVIDVSNPAAPRELGAYDTPGSAWGVAVSGTLVYVADHEAGLRVIDASDPAHPRELGYYDTPGYAWGVAVSGTLVYLADGDGGLLILRYVPPSNVSLFLPLVLVLDKRAPWCDPYEPNDDCWHPSGPLVSGQSYQAKLCRGDPQDNYYLDATTARSLQIRLQQPGALVDHTSLWVYSADDLARPLPNCGTGPIRVGDYRCTCSLPRVGRYVVRFYSEKPDVYYDDLNPYTLQVTYQ